MPSLTFRLRKTADAGAQLILVRDDGTHTLGTVGPADGYGPLHDLTHYAIEQTLGLCEGFLGLITSGWEISDFEVKGTAKRLPAEALFAEVAAGELSRQLLTRQVSSYEDFIWAIELTMDQRRPGYTRPGISSAQLESIHALIASAWRKWRELPPNDVLELTFTCERRSMCPPPTAAEREAGRLHQ